MEVQHDLSNELCASTPEEMAYMKKVFYASAVGSIMYAVRCTRPDVAFAQNLVSRYQQNPGKLHLVAVKHILKYLRNTRDMFLMYAGKPNTELDVTSFCDTSWQCDKRDTKSQMGYVFVVNGGAVDWKSKKQTTIAMHSAQAEYVAASEAAMEAVWIRKFVEDLGMMPSLNKPINMYCDNSAAIIFANKPGIMKGARHFLRRYHYVREQVETGEIKLIKRSKKNTKCVNAVSEELTAAKHKLMLPQVVSATKFPILNPNKFDLWKMRIEQYFLMTDYSLWEVILNGDSPIPSRTVEGVVQPVTLTTAKHKLARKN
uniref:Retrotransposon protein, putative, Ty1-copia subclass n=1 Tax=Tanacetum cinerariifolium TaxID=118510 RepID=A0A699L9Y6_TANCI|nr:retrotransposon protein, putative, Ty1-copia subclass [Tanacetum cinerariifolium]